VVLASEDFALFEDSALFAKAMDTCCNQDSWIVPGMPFANKASSAPFFIRASFRKYFCACVRACVAFLVPTICAIPLKSFGPTACSASKNLVCSKSVQYLHKRRVEKGSEAWLDGGSLLLGCCARERGPPSSHILVHGKGGAQQSRRHPVMFPGRRRARRRLLLRVRVREAETKKWGK
jgi:hypothetical protein